MTLRHLTVLMLGFPGGSCDTESRPRPHFFPFVRFSFFRVYTFNLNLNRRKTFLIFYLYRLDNDCVVI